MTHLIARCAVLTCVLAICGCATHHAKPVERTTHHELRVDVQDNGAIIEAEACVSADGPCRRVSLLIDTGAEPAVVLYGACRMDVVRTDHENPSLLPSAWEVTPCVARGTTWLAVGTAAPRLARAVVTTADKMGVDGALGYGYMELCDEWSLDLRHSAIRLGPSNDPQQPDQRGQWRSVVQLPLRHLMHTARSESPLLHSRDNLVAWLREVGREDPEAAASTYPDPAERPFTAYVEVNEERRGLVVDVTLGEWSGLALLDTGFSGEILVPESLRERVGIGGLLGKESFLDAQGHAHEYELLSISTPMRLGDLAVPIRAVHVGAFPDTQQPDYILIGYKVLRSLRLDVNDREGTIRIFQ